MSLPTRIKDGFKRNVKRLVAKPSSGYLTLVLRLAILVSVSVALLSTALIIDAENLAFCGRAQCFNDFFTLFKFPLGAGGVSIALLTLELSARRLYNMDLSFNVDKHYRRMDYFASTLERQVDEEKLSISVNYGRLYVWLFPDSQAGNYRISKEFESFVRNTSLVANRISYFLDHYVNSRWFPYIGPVDDVVGDISLPPYRCGISHTHYAPNVGMKSYQDSALMELANRMIGYSRFVSCVDKVNDVEISEVLQEEMLLLTNSIVTLQQKIASLNTAKSRLLEKYGLIRDKAISLDAYNERTVDIDKTKKAFETIRAGGIDAYGLAYILKQLKSYYSWTDNGVKEVGEFLGGDIFDAYMTIENSKEDQEFNDWAKELSPFS